MPNYAFSDLEIIELAEKDIANTIARLKERVLTVYGDLQTVDRKDVLAETAKTFDKCSQDLIGDAIGWVRAQMPSEHN